MPHSVPNTNHQSLLTWVESIRKHAQPNNVYWCDGTEEEYQNLCRHLVEVGTFIKLNEELRPNSYLARADPRDSDRDKLRLCTRICSRVKEDAGPTNNWENPSDMKKKLNKLLSGSMKGRTMYVVPYSMGPAGSPYSRFGVQITDSPYVVIQMKIMTRMGSSILKAMGEHAWFLRCVHSVGFPLNGQQDVPWPCNPDNTVIAVFPDDPYQVISYGSGYGANALLMKRGFALQIGSVLGKKEGWFAEHCLTISVTSPEGNKYYICAAFPNGCGKTNFATLIPTIPGWTVRCISDDTTWLHVGEDGKLYAINPEAGFFDRALGASYFTSRATMDTLTANSIFTNVALTPDGDVWWDGMTKEPPAELIDWTGQKWTPDCGRRAAHPNSRYTTPASQCPVIDEDWENPNGVPISAFIFGGRSFRLFPLVTEAFTWEHGVFLGSLVRTDSETNGQISTVRDPFAIGDYIGYHLGDHLGRWVDLRKQLGFAAPRMFFVNWFKKDKQGKTLWPGFGENSFILRWICRRLENSAEARRTPLGYVPTIRALDIGSLDISRSDVLEVLNLENEEWLKEIPKIREYFKIFGERFSEELHHQVDQMEKQLNIQESEPPTHNKALLSWVDQIRTLCKPEKVYWCSGTDNEYDELCETLVSQGTFIRLNEKLRPHSYLARSDPRDVARVESKTFICSKQKDDAGPTNNWLDPEEMKKRLMKLYDGCMKGRTMYVIPFCMGPLGSPFSKYGVEISDSPYVAVNMKIMTRMGTQVLNAMGDRFFLPCLHSVGMPLTEGKKDVPWPCDPDNTIIAHFPEELSVMSFGSGYGGNALLGKKCYSLRIASVMGRKEGWLAEHCLLLGLTSPKGKKFYIAAGFPSACGKTNLAMLVPTIPGWTVRCVGDDIAWLHVGGDGRLYGINPEAGFFGVAPGTSDLSNRSAMLTVKKNTIFTNVGLTPDGDVWWEGMTKEPPAELIDWTGQKWTPDCGRKAAHPNSRYTTPATQCPVMDDDWENPNGVPISAIIFGGRRNSLIPLVTEAFTWQHGVFMASVVSSELTAASEGKLGDIRRDPFAMLPFCGYNMADYFNHWIEFRKFLGYNCPKIFYVNWFRRDEKGGFLWPGFGENSRVLKWICKRIGRNPTGKSIRTPIGHIPSIDGLDLGGLDISKETMHKILKVDINEWLNEIPLIKKHYEQFGKKLPAALEEELVSLENRLHVVEEEPPTTNKKMLAWVDQMRTLCKPDKVYWCSGTEEEYNEMCVQLVNSGTFIRLNEKLRPNSFLARSDPRDVARVESKTFICSKQKDDAGPTNNWLDPEEMKKRLMKLYDGCMKGRTMYVIPFCMGPLGSPFSKYGVEISDSPYVVVNMKIMTRIGTKTLSHIGPEDFFLPCLHSVGMPLTEGKKDVPWPCDPDNTIIAHFPEELSVMSFGSGYGGNALLGKKCYSLRIASVMGRKEGWLAEHCLLLGLTSPERKKYYIAAGFPSACGKTNLAMLVPTIPGWTVRCVGDDIAWLHVGGDGRLYGINPEAGFFGVAPGTSDLSNRSAMLTVKKNTIFTNVGLTPDGDIWWEGMTKEPPAELIDWTGQKWTPDCGRKAAHPNSRYTTPATQCPVIDPDWDNPNGVPICAFIFGGRREKVVPLVTEAFIWDHGVFMGSIISSEQTAAAEGQVGSVRRDPFAMLPFCGYNMADYFNHWLDFRKNLGFLSPKIFYVNWFRKNAKGQYLWPGFGENSRVLKWICERVDGVGKARSTPIGYVPTSDALDLGGIDVGPETIHQLLHVDPEEWLREVPDIRKFYELFGNKLPASLKTNLELLENRLRIAQDAPTGNKKLIGWVEKMKQLCKPMKVHWCTGSQEEYDELCDMLIDNGTMVRLNPELRPNSFVARTDPRDVGRVEEFTYVCSKTKEEAGPNNKWANPEEMKQKLDKLFDGSMKGRTMYVIPFCMGPLGSPYSRFGVEITDSPYVVINMKLLSRMGTEVLNILNEKDFFLPCLHSVGVPLTEGKKDVSWPCNPDNTHICLFPEEPSVMSFGSGYGANAFASVRNYGLRIASVMAKKEGWFAEHCLVLGVTSPEGKTQYICGGIPTGCGKSSLASLIPPIPGWTVRLISDDIAWLHIGEDGRLYAINPANGFFDRVDGTSFANNRAVMSSLQKNAIFTNVATTPDGDVWWEGMTKEPPAELIDWTGQKWTPSCGRHASHSNSRYTSPAKECTVLDPEWSNPNGVPISSLLFGGRRDGHIPLVSEALSWEHGIFLASLVSQDRVIDGKKTVIREPFAMVPYVAYHIGDYLEKWSRLRDSLGYNIPKIFFVNWFRKDEKGKYLWPGHAENARVLKWIFQRNSHASSGKPVKTPLGFVPSVGDLDLRSLDISKENVKKLLQVDPSEWADEINEIRAFYAQFESKLPQFLKAELETLTGSCL